MIMEEYDPRSVLLAAALWIPALVLSEVLILPNGYEHKNQLQTLQTLSDRYFEFHYVLETKQDKF